MVGHHHFVGAQHSLQGGGIQHRDGVALQFGAAGHGVQQGAGAAALADVEGHLRLPELAAHADGALEHVLQIGEQAHLEFIAAELRTRLVEHSIAWFQRLRGLGIAPQRRLALGDAIQSQAR